MKNKLVILPLYLTRKVVITIFQTLGISCNFASLRNFLCNFAKPKGGRAHTLSPQEKNKQK